MIFISMIFLQEGSTALSIAMDARRKDLALLIYGSLNFDKRGQIKLSPSVSLFLFLLTLVFTQKRQYIYAISNVNKLIIFQLSCCHNSITQIWARVLLPEAHAFNFSMLDWAWMCKRSALTFLVHCVFNTIFVRYINVWPSKHTTLFQRPSDVPKVQKTLKRRQNNVLC